MAKKNRRTAKDIQELVPQFRQELKNGSSMKDLKKKHGFASDVPIRIALAIKGFDSKGNSMEIKAINPMTAAGHRQIVKDRNEGTPWYILSIATGCTESHLRKLVESEGGQAKGRVYRAPKPKGPKTKAKRLSDTPAKIVAKTKTSKTRRRAAKADPQVTA